MVIVLIAVTLIVTVVVIALIIRGNNRKCDTNNQVHNTTSQSYLDTVCTEEDMGINNNKLVETKSNEAYATGITTDRNVAYETNIIIERNEAYVTNIVTKTNEAYASKSIGTKKDHCAYEPDDDYIDVL